MTRSRVWLVLVLFAAALAFPAIGQGAELKTLKGQTITGTLVSIDGKEIVLTVDGKMVATPLAQVLVLDVVAPTKLPANAEPIQIELVDGSTLLVKDLLIKKNEVVYTPFVGGKETTIPVAVVANILRNPQDEKLRKQWAELVGSKRDRDILAFYKDEILQPLRGTLGEGNAAGNSIEFTLAGSTTKREVELSRANGGLIFFRTPNPLAPPINARLADKDGNLLMVSTLATEGENLVATTSSSVKFTVPLANLAKLDYSKGKQTFLSELAPDRKVLESASGERFAQLMIDKNLNGTGPMRLKGEQFTRGLAMFTYTELEYNLKGDYLEFRATAGIDDEINGADSSVHLLIEGDGKELLSLTFNRQDKVRAQPIALNIKDVNRLRIVVSDPDGKDIGKHLDLANAQITK
jgi:hypothetical protein